MIIIQLPNFIRPCYSLLDLNWNIRMHYICFHNNSNMIIKSYKGENVANRALWVRWAEMDLMQNGELNSNPLHKADDYQTVEVVDEGRNVNQSSECNLYLHVCKLLQK